jgi:phosphate transport system substrate-binding protein
MRKILSRIALGAAVIGLLACSSAATSAGPRPAAGKLVLTGSSTIAPLASEIGKRFEVEHPGVRVDVQSGGSSRGIGDARQGTADIGMASRALKEGEGDLQAFTIARDGITIILHSSNPVRELSGDQVVAIYLGKVTNWREVGGDDAPITVVNKAEGRSTLELFAQFFRIENKDIVAHVVIGDNEQGIKTVAGNPNAIGYVSIGSAEFSATNAVPIKLLPVDGIAATTENVRNGTFPLARPLNLVTRAEPEGVAKDFLDFARSPAMFPIVKEQYFVPLGE